MANKLIHKKSSVITDNNPKLPQADSLEFGEIAINYADGYETISFKNTEHEIIEFRSKKYFEDIISENEEAVSQSLNNLNTRVEITQKAIESKQDKINDIEDIRTGAALGATALQSYTEKYKGTVTGVKINGTTKKPSSGVVDLGTVITSHQDISGKAPNNHASTATTYGVATSGTSAKYGHVKLVSGDVKSQTYANGVAAAAAHTHSNYLTSHQDISGKADKSSLAAVATSGSYNDLTNKPTIPSAVSESTVSGWGFTKNTGTVTGVKINGTTKDPSSGVVDLGTVLTSHQDISGKAPNNHASTATTYGVATSGTSATYGHVKLVSGDVKNQTYANGVAAAAAHTHSNYLTSHQDISGKADKSSLAAVATSGSYNDLTNKPTIPAAITESTVSGWGFTKNTGTYSKPSTGIPKSDLASAVQTSLGKADTALQSYTEKYKGTVTGVKINGTTKKPSSGVVDLGTVITSHQDISGKAPNNHASTATTYGVATSGTSANYGHVKLVSGDVKSQTYSDGVAAAAAHTHSNYLTSHQDISGKAPNNHASTATTYGVATSGKSAKYGHVKLVSGDVKGQTYTNGVAAAAAHTHSNYLTSHQDISGKQDVLVSGTNIKTVNNNSLLGSGNISVGTITKVQANGADVSSSGTANIPAASTTAYGVTKLSSSTSSTSTSLAATASAVKSAYDLANSKWTYNADTIKAVKVNNAVAADSASAVAWSGITSKPTTISGYGITDAYTKSAANGKFITGDRDAYDVNTLYNAGIHMVANGSNVPCGSEYGVCLTLPYRQLYGNSKTDFGAQIFLPNGDDAAKPNSMFFRTSLGDTWNAWQEVATESAVSGWGFTKNTGTVTGVKINGTTKNPSSGVVDLGYINKQLSTSTSSTMTLSPNIYYRNTSTSLSTLTITLGSVSNSNIINEYFVEFTTSSSGTTVSLPSTIKWANGEQPKFDASTTYQISIVNNLGTIQKFK